MDPHAARLAVHVEPLTEQHFEGARALFNVFMGARKRMFGILPYFMCATTRNEFAAPYRKFPQHMSLGAVAVRTDGAVVGLLQLSQTNSPRDPFTRCLHVVEPDECYIEHVVVAADCRGQGVGTKLLEWSEKRALELGAKKLTLGVVNGNPAQRLYERFGFQVKEVATCSHACTSCIACCLLGLPHGQCGAVSMEKPLANQLVMER